MSNTPLVRWLQLVAMLVLSVGAWSLAGPAGAQDAAAEECGTYGPACPTSSGTGGASSSSGDAADGSGATGTTGGSGSATGDSGSATSGSGSATSGSGSATGGSGSATSSGSSGGDSGSGGSGGGSGQGLSECLPAVGGLSLESGSLVPAGDFVISGDGFKPGSQIKVYVCSAPILLETSVADSSGSFQAAGTVPTDLAAGLHQIVAYGVDTDGSQLVKDISFTVGAATTAGTGGISTGGSSNKDDRNCDEIEAQTGRTNILRGDQLYRPDLDVEKGGPDGIACEEPASSSSGSDGGSSGATSAGTPGASAQALGQSSTPGELGRTGTSASTLAILAVAVVLMGSALVLGARRRS